MPTQKFRAHQRRFLMVLFGVFVVSPFAHGAPAARGDSGEAQKLLIVGDSLSDGYGVKREQAYPQLLENALISQGLKVKVINAAESGAISSSALPTLEFYYKRVQPDVVLIAIGGNDARAQKPVKTIKDNIEKAIVFAKDKKLTVVLAGQKIFSNLGKEYTGAFEALYKELAEKHKVVFVPFLLEGVAGNKSLNIADGFHPNTEGHKKIASHLLPQVSNTLKSARAETPPKKEQTP